MPLLCWSEQYSVKVSTFDKHHQVLFNLINQLHEAMRVGKGATVIGSVLAELAKYTAEHFAAEESAMQRQGYPGFEAHRAQHQVFTNKVAEFSREFVAGRVALSTSVIDFLMDWLKQHIIGTDQKYSEFFNKRGIA